jgi:hypothetical protein
LRQGRQIVSTLPLRSFLAQPIAPLLACPHFLYLAPCSLSSFLCLSVPSPSFFPFFSPNSISFPFSSLCLGCLVAADGRVGQPLGRRMNQASVHQACRLQQQGPLSSLFRSLSLSSSQCSERRHFELENSLSHLRTRGRGMDNGHLEG